MTSVGGTIVVVLHDSNVWETIFPESATMIGALKVEGASLFGVW